MMMTGRPDDTTAGRGRAQGWTGPAERLEPGERDALDLLTVIGGRFDLAAAAAVLDDPDEPGVGTGLLIQSLADHGQLIVERSGGRTLYSLHRSARDAAARTERMAGKRAQSIRRLGRLLVRQLAGRRDDGHWLAEVEPRLGTLTAAVEDLIPLEPDLAALVALVIGRYHRARRTVGAIQDQMAAWAEQLPPSHDSRVLTGELVTYFQATYRRVEVERWTERHERMTEVLGVSCPYRPTESLRAGTALLDGDAARAEALCRQVLVGGARGAGGVAAQGWAALYAYWNLGAALAVLERFDEAEDNTRRALALAVELGELTSTVELTANLVELAAHRRGWASQARNLLRWYDVAWVDPVAGNPRLTEPASWIALDLGRHLDAARLGRVLQAAGPNAMVYLPGGSPDDLLAQVRVAAPQAYDAAFQAELLSPADALALARDVLTDPALPPQDELIDPFPDAARAVGPSPGGAPPRLAPAGPLRALPASEQDQVMAVARVRRYQRGQMLLAHGEAGSTTHVVLSGWVGFQMLTAGGEVATVDLAGPGEVVGDSFSLPPSLLPSTGAAALGPVETLMLPSGLVDDLRRRRPAFQEALVELLVARVRRLSGAVTDALYLPVDHRVLRRLVDLCDRQGRAGGPVEILLTQDELATMVGSTRPTVNRVLHRVEADGHLRRARGRITVTDVEALRRRIGLP